MALTCNSPAEKGSGLVPLLHPTCACPPKGRSVNRAVCWTSQAYLLLNALPKAAMTSEPAGGLCPGPQYITGTETPFYPHVPGVLCRLSPWKHNSSGRLPAPCARRALCPMQTGPPASSFRGCLTVTRKRGVSLDQPEAGTFLMLNMTTAISFSENQKSFPIPLEMN